MTWTGRPFEPDEPTIEDVGVDFLMDATYGTGQWADVVSRGLPLPPAEQRRRLAVLQATLWPKKEAA